MILSAQNVQTFLLGLLMRPPIFPSDFSYPSDLFEEYPPDFFLFSINSSSFQSSLKWQLFVFIHRKISVGGSGLRIFRRLLGHRVGPAAFVRSLSVREIRFVRDNF